MRLSQRSAEFQSSGIRRVFDLAAKLSDPINLSIGQPDFDVPEPIRRAAATAIEERRNGYAPTQGIPLLVQRLQSRIDQQYGHADRQVLVTSGTSGGLVLAILALVNPGDEVIIFDPYFVAYPSLIRMAGGVPIFVPTDRNFQIDLDRVRSAITSRTRVIVLNSPANPTGVVAKRPIVEELGRLADEHDVALISDEIYSQFCYDQPLYSPAESYERTIVIDGFSKSHAMTGWRVGWIHGPRTFIETLAKIQQYTFVCAPQPAQWAALAALETDMSDYQRKYRQKRDCIVAGLKDKFEFPNPEGAFYLFPKVPSDMTGSQWAERAIEQKLLIIPGNVFSNRDTHFRISYAVDDRTLERGIDVLNKLC